MDYGFNRLVLYCTISNRLSETCKSKCISKTYDDGDLSKAEGVCLDRCVAKVWCLQLFLLSKKNEDS